MKRLTDIALITALALSIAGTALTGQGNQDTWLSARIQGIGGSVGTMEHGTQDPWKPGGGSVW